MSVQNPHDRFFRQSFGRPDIARNFLEEYLPSELRQVMDLDELTLQDGSFVDEEMQTHHTDLVYQVRLTNSRQAYLYFLFEHKSYPDPLVAFQLLRYMTRLWERQQQDKESFAPIIPLVIYHGEKRWQVAPDFLAVIDAPPELTPYLPNFRYLLNDFSHLSNETIRGEIWLRVSLAIMRAIFDPALQSNLSELISLVLELRDKSKGIEYIYTILYYLSDATDRLSRDELQVVLTRHSEQGDRLMTTIAQEFRQEGFEKGIKQGGSGCKVSDG